MAVRFYDYSLLTEPTPQIEAVLDVLRSSYVRDTTALHLLSALAQAGERFVITCDGDYHCEIASEDCLNDELPEEAYSWINEILGEH